MERMTIATVLRTRVSMIQMRMEMDCRTGKNSTSMEQTQKILTQMGMEYQISRSWSSVVTRC